MLANRKKHKHKHLFRNVGGGTLLVGNTRLPSDDEYECKCGRRFITKSTTEKHFKMPDKYKQKPRSSKILKVSEMDWEIDY